MKHVSPELFEQMVETVADWLMEAPEDDRISFTTLPESELVLYHITLGRDIRNEFNLWQYGWVPQIEDGIDVSPEHPDAVSMRVIREVWSRFRVK